MERHQCLVYRCFFFLIQSRPQGAPVQQLFLSCLLHSRAYILSVRPVGVGVVSVTVKCPALPPCAIDGRSRNPLYYYYHHCYYYFLRPGRQGALLQALFAGGLHVTASDAVAAHITTTTTTTTATTSRQRGTSTAAPSI